MADVPASARRLFKDAARRTLIVCAFLAFALDGAAARTMETPSPLTLGAADNANDRTTAINPREQHCLATAIYFEARGESERGQRAVADVILARVRSPGWPKTICGVVYEGAHRKSGCQFSFACDSRRDTCHGEAWSTAKHLAAEAMRSGDAPDALPHDATYFHAKGVRPSWSKHMIRVALIGSHIFYRPRPTHS